MPYLPCRWHLSWNRVAPFYLLDFFDLVTLPLHFVSSDIFHYLKSRILTWITYFSFSNHFIRKGQEKSNILDKTDYYKETKKGNNSYNAGNMRLNSLSIDWHLSIYCFHKGCYVLIRVCLLVRLLICQLTGFSLLN